MKNRKVNARKRDNEIYKFVWSDRKRKRNLLRGTERNEGINEIWDREFKET